ncbi:MAG TPA: hypothetical protein VH593_04305 [Ktedonobacteraceae bacterium]
MASISYLNNWPTPSNDDSITPDGDLSAWLEVQQRIDQAGAYREINTMPEANTDLLLSLIEATSTTTHNGRPV